MDFHLWLTFSLTTFLICFAPGPNMLHMMTSGAKYGLRRTCYSMAGCFLAVSGMIAVSVAGIGAVLQASPHLFDGLRYAGAAYLFYLGVQAWRSPLVSQIDPETCADLRAAATPSALLRGGFLIGISNPKALLFAGAFFPQFIDASAPQLPQLTILFVTFTVLEISCYALYATGGQRIAGMLKHAAVRRAFSRVTGALFMAFGALLVAKAA